MNLRDFLSHLAENKELTTINKSVSTQFELANVAHTLSGKATLFNEITGYPGWRVCSGVAADRSYFATALNQPIDQIQAHLANALTNPRTAPTTTTAPCQEIIYDKEHLDLYQLPILRHLPQDPGEYVASNVVIINDPDFGPNMCYHRLLRLSHNQVVARIVENRGTHTAVQKTEGDLPVAICIGLPIHILLAASMAPPPGISELDVAHALAPTPLVKCLTNDIYVPAEAEIVLEGRITKKQTSEGPFMDLTETMDIVRQQSIIEIDLITTRKDPIYHALLPGGLEHKLLMGMPKEPTIFAAVNQVTRCLGVNITPGGASWLHAVVQIDKQKEEDGRLAIEAAFKGHGSLKHVWIVDTDIDLYDPQAVEWAVATRFQASTNLHIYTNQPGSSLDPSGSHIPGQKSKTDKVGFDCTLPLNANMDKYQRAEYKKVDLSAYL